MSVSCGENYFDESTLFSSEECECLVDEVTSIVQNTPPKYLFVYKVSEQSDTLKDETKPLKKSRSSPIKN